MTTSDTKETTHQQPSLFVDHLLARREDPLQEVQRTTFASLHLHLVTIVNAVCHIDAARGKAKRNPALKHCATTFSRFGLNDITPASGSCGA